MLARNSDIEGAFASIKSLEEKFNSKFNYPYVFLNDVPFTEEFKRCAKRIVSVPPNSHVSPAAFQQELAQK